MSNSKDAGTKGAYKDHKFCGEDQSPHPSHPYMRGADYFICPGEGVQPGQVGRPRDYDLRVKESRMAERQADALERIAKVLETIAREKYDLNID